jgi:hypothetical protein
MTPNQFRKLALAIDGAVEAAHMHHPDFRVAGKIFASLGAPSDEFAMVRLSPAQQKVFVSAEPEVFSPCIGAWGRAGCTLVSLATANKTTISAALVVARENLPADKPIKKRSGPSAPKGKESKPKATVRSKGNSKSPGLSRSLIDKVARRMRGLIDRLPEATAVPGGQGHLSLEVRGKRLGWFLVDHHGDGRIALSCKAKPGASQSLVLKSPLLFHTPKYMGRHGWIGVWLDKPNVPWGLVFDTLKEAYLLSAPKTLAQKLALTLPADRLKD